MPHVFQLNKLDGFSNIELFYHDFAVYLYKDISTTAVFDLNDVVFITPEALLALLCASKHWRIAKGTKVEWRASESVKLYLERTDILQVFADDIVVTRMPDEHWARGASLSLMEIREIDYDIEQNSMDVSNTILAVSNLLLGRVSIKQLGGASTLLSEVIQNVIHSNSIGYVLVQTYQNGGSHSVHIGVIDTGIGVATSLSPKYPGLPKPSEYLKRALQSGVTSSTAGNGLGLFRVESIVSKGRGALTIRSGTAMLQIYKNKMYQWDDLADIPGTQVYITMWGEHERGKWEYLLSC
jgi:hypothetical protein